MQPLTLRLVVSDIPEEVPWLVRETCREVQQLFDALFPVKSAAIKTMLTELRAPYMRWPNSIDMKHASFALWMHRVHPEKEAMELFIRLLWTYSNSYVDMYPFVNSIVFRKVLPHIIKERSIDVMQMKFIESCIGNMQLSVKTFRLLGTPNNWGTTRNARSMLMLYYRKHYHGQLSPINKYATIRDLVTVYSYLELPKKAITLGEPLWEITICWYAGNASNEMKAKWPKHILYHRTEVPSQLTEWHKVILAHYARRHRI